MENPCKSKTARAWLRVHEHENRVKQIKANPLTDPGMYKTMPRKEQLRQIQSGGADKITELGESMASMAAHITDETLE